MDRWGFVSGIIKSCDERACAFQRQRLSTLCFLATGTDVKWLAITWGVNWLLINKTDLAWARECTFSQGPNGRGFAIVASVAPHVKGGEFPTKNKTGLVSIRKTGQSHRKMQPTHSMSSHCRARTVPPADGGSWWSGRKSKAKTGRVWLWSYITSGIRGDGNPLLCVCVSPCEWVMAKISEGFFQHPPPQLPTNH